MVVANIPWAERSDVARALRRALRQRGDLRLRVLSRDGAILLLPDGPTDRCFAERTERHRDAGGVTITELVRELDRLRGGRTAPPAGRHRRRGRTSP